jgi:hypothetical protein
MLNRRTQLKRRNHTNRGTVKLNRRNVIQEKIISQTVANHWEVITSSGPEECFVCDKVIRDNAPSVCIGFHNQNFHLLYRHPHCEPGSPNWFSKFGGYVCKDIDKIRFIPADEPLTMKKKKKKKRRRNEIHNDKL